MQTIDSLVSWWDAHAAVLAVVLAVATTAARALWTALGPSVRTRHPRIHAAIEALGAISPDLWRAVTVVARAVAAARSARPPAPPSAPSGQSGRATVATLVLLALVGALGLAACPRAREAVVDTQSPRVACAPTSQRCHEGAPEVCSATGRWWPAMPPQDDGARRRCADVCEVSPAGIAHCASSQVVTP